MPAPVTVSRGFRSSKQRLGVVDGILYTQFHHLNRTMSSFQHPRRAPFSSFLAKVVAVAYATLVFRVCVQIWFIVYSNRGWRRPVVMRPTQIVCLKTPRGASTHQDSVLFAFMFDLTRSRSSALVIFVSGSRFRCRKVSMSVCAHPRIDNTNIDRFIYQLQPAFKFCLCPVFGVWISRSARFQRHHRSKNDRLEHGT
jgi:hypothetical protein